MEPWRPTGRQRFGPGCTIDECAKEQHLGYAIRFDRDLFDAATFNSVSEIVPFLEDPKATGIAPLAWTDIEHGVFGYRTGPGWFVGDIMKALRAPNAPAHDKAALQLLAKLGDALDRAAEESLQVSRYGHGGLDPWRVLVNLQGEVQVLGYALPPLALTATEHPTSDVLRYCPPERLKGEPEDIRSDLLSATLMAFEWMTGKALFVGDNERVHTAAKRGLGVQRLHASRHLMDESVVEVFLRALALYPDSRYPTGKAFADACLDAANSPRLAGPSLQEVMAWVAKQDDDGPREVAAPATPRDARRNSDAQASSPREARWSVAERGHDNDLRANPNERRTRRAAPATHRPDRNAIYPTEPMGGDQASFRVLMSDQTVSLVTLSQAETLAMSAARLVDQLEFSPVDLTGKIRGWYRILQGDDGWYGHAPTSHLQTNEALVLQFFENQTVAVTVDVPSEGIRDHRVHIGTAVHTQFLIGELRRQMQLPGTRWRIKIEEVILDLWQVVDDFDLEPGARIELVRATT